MTEDFFEQFRKTKENFVFQYRFRDVLREFTSDIRGLRVLDFGAGAFPHIISMFSTIQKDQYPTVAYDPAVRLTAEREETARQYGLNWTIEPPAGQNFDLVVCSFSLHHMSGTLENIIKGLKIYNPKFIAISDYNYNGSELEDFERTFINQEEKKELMKLFGGNEQECFEFHKRYSQKDFEEALRKNGFNPVHTEYGHGIARHKFLVIGKSETT